MSRNVNNVLCIDHVRLYVNRVLHITDSITRYSDDEVVKTKYMRDSIDVFEAQWISPF